VHFLVMTDTLLIIISLQGIIYCLMISVKTKGYTKKEKYVNRIPYRSFLVVGNLSNKVE
jgi:hypothetical protein